MTPRASQEECPPALLAAKRREASELRNAQFLVALSVVPKIPMVPRAPVNAVAGLVGRPDLLQVSLVLTAHRECCVFIHA